MGVSEMKGDQNLCAGQLAMMVKKSYNTSGNTDMKIEWTLDQIDDEKVIKGKGSIEELMRVLKDLNDSSVTRTLNIRLPEEFIKYIKGKNYSLTDFTIYAIEAFLKNNGEKDKPRPPQKYQKKKTVSLRLPVKLLSMLDSTDTTFKKSTLIIRAIERMIETTKSSG
jgi:hypothetical protein